MKANLGYILKQTENTRCQNLESLRIRPAWFPEPHKSSLFGYIISVLLLAGCSTSHEDFSSEPGEGFGWKSMSENHQRIQAMLMSSPLEVKPPVIIGHSSPYTIASAPWTETSGAEVKRIPEQYLRIWVPPYQDAQGNLHEEQAIHTIVQQGQWVLPQGVLPGVKEAA